MDALPVCFVAAKKNPNNNAKNNDNNAKKAAALAPQPDESIILWIDESRIIL